MLATNTHTDPPDVTGVLPDAIAAQLKNDISTAYLVKMLGETKT